MCPRLAFGKRQLCMSATSHKWRILSRRCGELTAWLEVILPADAPAPARLASGMSFPTSLWRRRHAAPPSHPLPCTTYRFYCAGCDCKFVVFDACCCITGTKLSKLACSCRRAGVHTYTHLLDLSSGWRIAPLPCPTGANSPMLRPPQPPRVFPAPLCHSDSGSTRRLDTPSRCAGM